MSDKTTTDSTKNQLNSKKPELCIWDIETMGKKFDQKAPREFWIIIETAGEGWAYLNPSSMLLHRNEVHVIEKSTYDAIEQKLEEAKRLLKLAIKSRQPMDLSLEILSFLNPQTTEESEK
jgi:hypothetical protein